MSNTKKIFMPFAFLLTVLVACVPTVTTSTTPEPAVIVSTLIPASTSAVTQLPMATPTQSIALPTPNAIEVKEQKDIERVIRAYFDIRYQAHDIAQSEALHIDSFSHIVSSEADAQSFLDAELGKLAVELKYAELNRSRYVDYEYFLDFNNYDMTDSFGLATVLVSESNKIIYERAVESNPEKPRVTQMSAIMHTIILRKEEGQWKIVSDDYNDFLWRTLRESGKSTDEMLEMLNSMKTLTARQ